jgi:hypothetical protein
VDFHHPEDEYYWLAWNRAPAEKHSWLTRDFRASVAWGTPVYEYAQTLLGHRYLEDPEVTRLTTAHVEASGGREFFARPGWRQELTGVVEGYARTHPSAGRYETDAEYRDRVLDEMQSCKRDIATRLGKPVDFLCWPCGDYTPVLQQLAIEQCGYLATVNVNKVSNRAGDSPIELRRIVFGQDYTGPRQADLLLMHFAGNVRYHSGDRRAFPIAPIARRLMKLGRALSG